MVGDEERNDRTDRSREPSRYVQDYEPLTVFFAEALERRLRRYPQG
jgi:hypothetical protein